MHCIIVKFCVWPAGDSLQFKTLNSGCYTVYTVYVDLDVFGAHIYYSESMLLKCKIVKCCFGHFKQTSVSDLCLDLRL